MNPLHARVDPNPSPEPAAPTDERRVVAWIGRSVHIEGKVISAEDLNIDGHVDGSVELSGHNLSVGLGGTIRADLLAKSITISGAVTGNVSAQEKVDLRATGSVNGDISAPRLIMADGAIVAGRIDVDGPPKG